MARRVELKNVVQGILGSFNSRNNDVDGYWGIGKLHRAAYEAGTRDVIIDLLSSQISLNTRDFEPLLASYRAMLHQHLARSLIPVSWIAEARMALCFDTEFNKRFHFFRTPIGEPYTCSLTIIDDRAKEYGAVTGGFCWRHEPRKESRSGR